MRTSRGRHAPSHEPTPRHTPRHTRPAPHCDPLEPRHLLAAAPAELLARLPTAPESVNVRFQDVAPLGDRWLVTTEHESQPERLYVTKPLGSPAPPEPTLLFTSPYGASPQKTFGVTALTPYHGQIYFLANGDAGDALYATDGSAVRTVKLIRDYSNALPRQIGVVQRP